MHATENRRSAQIGSRYRLYFVLLADLKEGFVQKNNWI